MSFRVRPATGDDFRAIYEMAKLTGGGFTNLPADKRHAGRQARALGGRVRARRATARRTTSTCSCSRTRRPKQIRGTCQVFGQVGVVQPFYSYHLSTLTQTSPELGKTFRNQTLTLTTDLEGSSRGRRPVPPSRGARRRLGRAARAQPLSVHQAAPRALRRPHAGRASRSDGRSRQLALLGRARRPLLRHELPRGRRVQRASTAPSSSPT